MKPETCYARSGDVNIAYQVVGEGPLDLVLVPGWVSNIEVFWEEPLARPFLRAAGIVLPPHPVRQARDRTLGSGVADVPNLETRMDDVRAVMDAVGSERAALFGYSEGGPMCALFAATYPDRTSALDHDRQLRAADLGADYPWGTDARGSGRPSSTRSVATGAGPSGSTLRAPSVANDERFATGGPASCASARARPPAGRPAAR